MNTKIELERNHLGFYSSGYDYSGTRLSLCEEGIQKVFNINSPEISLTIKDKNPKKKGFKKVHIDFSNRLIIHGVKFGINFYTCDFISKWNLKGATVWVKIEPI